MIAQVGAQIPPPDETVATVVERTGGVPLFVEKLRRGARERRNETKRARNSRKYHDLLMARPDRLGSAKEVLQIGAVIGGEFSNQLLNAVHPTSEEALQRGSCAN